MTIRGKSQSGEFEFVVTATNGEKFIGRLEWKSIDKPDREVDFQSRIFIHDNRLESATDNEDGTWSVFPVGPVYFETSFVSANEVAYAAVAQDELLRLSIDRARSLAPNFDKICNNYNIFESALTYAKNQEYQNIPLLHKASRFLHRFIWGERMYDMNATRRAEDLGPNPAINKHSVKCFQLITSLAGVTTVILCVLFVNIDFSKIAIAVFASVTAWAARETTLVDDKSGNYDYTFSNHWRSSMWKLIGYVSTAMVSVALLSGIHSGFVK